MSARIDHAAEAQAVVRALMEYGEVPANIGPVVDMLAALTHATLALVEQQRVANLIAADWRDIEERLRQHDEALRGES